MLPVLCLSNTYVLHILFILLNMTHAMCKQLIYTKLANVTVSHTYNTRVAYSRAMCTAFCSMDDVKCLAVNYMAASQTCQLNDRSPVYNIGVSTSTMLGWDVYYRDPCDAGWIAYGGSCYKIVTSLLNWDNSKLNCEAQEAQLVEIESEEENSFLDQIAGTSFYVGLVEINGVSQTFVWVSGRSTTYSNWSSGQLNSGSSEHCVTSNNPAWYDVRCNVAYASVCEKRYV